MSHKRSIFEEVSEKPREPIAPMASLSRQDIGRGVRIWLWVLFFLIVLMVMVGGVTRLTDSGLSITDWDLLKGVLPPLNAENWQEKFQKYQQTEEFKLINSTMTLSEFQSIFWWEWGHRLLGRLIGLVWLLGFLYFFMAKAIRKDRLSSIIQIGVLIILQGVVGILMVKTGYIGSRVDVASLALALHLSLAFFILGLIYWNLKLLKFAPENLVEMRRRGDIRRARYVKILLGFVWFQVVLGAMVAGIDAGKSYTDWPLMGGEFFSSDSLMMKPLWRNFVENPALVQFLHRMNAYLLFALALVLYFRTRQAPYKQWKFVGFHILIAILMQIALGVVTLILNVQIHAALTHQFFAIGIWIAVIAGIFAFCYPKPQSVKS